MSDTTDCSAAGVETAEATVEEPYDYTKPCNTCQGFTTIVKGHFDQTKLNGGTAPLVELPCPTCQVPDALTPPPS